MCNSGNSVFILLVIWYLNTNEDSQLIGEEKKQVVLEQAMLERLRPILMETTRTLATEVGRLEEENRQMKIKIGNLEEEISQMDPKGGSLEEENKLVNGCPISKTCTVTGLICPRLVMDPATLYPDRFLSRDKLTLSNKRLDSTFDWPTTDDRVYRGVQGLSVITNQQISYFETEIHYLIKNESTSPYLVFEVAFTTEETMGEYFYVGNLPMSWSVSAYYLDIERVVLSFKGRGNIKYSEILSDKIPLTVGYLKLGFYINRPDRIIAVLDIDRNRKIHTFTDVDGTLELWPVFGVYNPHLLSASIRLNSERNITSVPCDLF